MTEAEIAQSLQKDLIYFKVNVAVRQKGNHLHVLVNRTAEQSVDYSSISRLIRANLRDLRDRKIELAGIQVVTVYGRVMGEKDYEWEVSADLDRSEDSDREGATIFIPEDSPQIEDEPTAIALPDNLSQLRRSGPLIPLSMPTKPAPVPTPVPQSQESEGSKLPPWAWGAIGGGIIGAIILVVWLVLRS